MKRIVVVAALAAACASTEAPAPQTALVEKAAPQGMSFTSKSPEAIAALKSGLDSADNMRLDEAAEQFKKAVTLDPDFAYAHASLGMATPGPEGMAELEKAQTLGAGASEAEKTDIAARLAMRKGDEATSAQLVRKLADLAPTDYRARLGLVMVAMSEHKYDEAIAEAKKAAELNPTGAGAYNQLGYASLGAGKLDDAIAAFQKYAQLLPNEPNAHDSLGDAYLKAGRFADAEAAYKKAIDLSPRFWISWDGVAISRLLRGDVAGGEDALAKCREAAPRPADKLGVDTMRVWVALAQGKDDDALKLGEAMDKDAQTAGLPGARANAAILRAQAYFRAGKDDKAASELSAALTDAADKGIPEGQADYLRALTAAHRAELAAKAAKGDDAAKAAADAGALAKKHATAVDYQDFAHLADGFAAWAKGDAKGAAAAFAQCSPDVSYCHAEHALALEKAGDKAGADAVRAEVAKANLRDGIYVFALWRLLGARPAGGAAAVTSAPSK